MIYNITIKEIRTDINIVAVEDLYPEPVTDTVKNKTIIVVRSIVLVGLVTELIG